MSEGVEIVVSGEQATVTIIDKAVRGKTAAALLKAGGRDQVSTVSTVRGIGYRAPVDVVRAAGLLDETEPDAPAEPEAEPQRAPARRPSRAKAAKTDADS